MKLLFRLILPVLVLFAVSPSRAECVRHFDLVFDLDDTLIRWIRPDERVGESTVIPARGDIRGYRYRVLDGAPQILQAALSLDPCVRVSIFSAGPEARNLEVLRELRLPDGRRAIDVTYRILSDKDTIQGTKKDLHRISGAGIEDVLLIDDNRRGILPGQESNFVWIGDKPPRFATTVEESAEGAAAFLRDRNKLVRAAGMLDLAFEKSRHESVSLAQAGHAVQAGAEQELTLYRRGLRLLNQVQPGFHLITIVPRNVPISCLRVELEKAIGAFH